MKRIASLVIPGFIGLAITVSGASAQQKSLKEQLTGTWVAVSLRATTPDGKTQDVWGPNPKGILIYDANGHYAQILLRSDVPKFKASTRLQGTPEENAAVVHGAAAQFGTWSVDEATKTVTAHNEGNMFPNSVGAEQKTVVVSVTTDELRIKGGLNASGTTSSNVFKRAR